MFNMFYVFSLISVLFIGLGSAAIAYGGEPGVRGGTFLKLPAGPRAAAMGDAQVGVAAGAYAPYWNPAGLGQHRDFEVAIMHQRSFQDIREQNVALALPIGRRMSIGGFASHVAVNPFSSFDASGNSVGQVESSEGVYGGAFGLRLFDGLFVGGGGKVVKSELGPVKATTHAFDVGILGKIPFSLNSKSKNYLTVGVAAKNNGPALVYDGEKTNLPRSLNFGVGLEAPFGKNRLSYALDYNTSPDHESFYSFGLEFWFKRFLALRSGYRFGRNEADGIRGGLALGVGNVQMAYSISPFSVLGTAHRVGFIFRYGLKGIKKIAPPVLPAIVPQEVKPKAEEPVEPKIVVPVSKPAPKKFKKVPKKKAAVKKKFKKKKRKLGLLELLELGKKHLRQGSFDKASKVFGQALRIEPNHAEALELLRKSLNELERKNKRERGIYE